MRDSKQTKSRILDAARHILAREGFAGLGVNALAAEAGVGKPLIYRYFGDMAGVATALAGDIASDGAGLEVTSPAEAVKALIGYGRGLAGDRTRRDLIAWSLAAGKAAGDVAGDGAVSAGQEPGAGAPLTASLTGSYEDADPAAVMAILQAATAFLLIYSDRHGSWAGMPLSEPRHLARMERAMAAIARATLSSA